MDDLVQFLRDRYDEVERIARAATPGPWEQTPKRVGCLASADYWEVVDCSGTPTARENAEHAAQHDPARVLRDIDAKRQAVGACAEWLHDSTDGIDPCAASVLAALALPYADHPKYKQTWRP
ncbi:DUF6221 family protein [Streptomyces sp. NPDC058620]|uniref:DUF6221 family protein n=1 Tax=Streptomyces sp. NPDC058620 TaxID=3346560 RepID=UPI003666BEF8